MRKIYFLLLFILGAIPAHSQFSPKIYAGLNGLYNKGFEKNIYGSFEIGAELFEVGFLAPEIGLKYYTGSPKELEVLNFDQNPPEGLAKFDSRFNSFVFSLGPKITFGNEEAALVIIPEFNIGNIRTYKRYFSRNRNSYELSEAIDDSQRINFWNFSAGIEGNFFDLDKVTFSVLLNYSTINTEKEFNNLQFANTSRNYNAGSEDGIGLTIRAYVDIFQK